ncbi:MAG: hypothetical protein JWP25_2254 [Bradyrhizobium sp.]|nr:hypothetical protein [Bradyrhizobium sp.]
MAALAVNKADTARIRSEVDIRRSLQGWCAPARLTRASCKFAVCPTRTKSGRPFSVSAGGFPCREIKSINIRLSGKAPSLRQIYDSLIYLPNPWCYEGRILGSRYAARWKNLQIEVSRGCRPGDQAARRPGFLGFSISRREPFPEEPLVRKWTWRTGLSGCSPPDCWTC